MRSEKSRSGKSKASRGSKSGGGRFRAEYRRYAYTQVVREWLRNGTHPYPGLVVRETKIDRTAWLRVNEVECYGLAKALKFERMRQIEKALDREGRRRVINSPKVINSPSEKFQRKGK